MDTRITLICLMILLPALANCSGPDQAYRSPYAGEETREIKSLSAGDIDELTHGRGWGLAKAAELNGMPGPAHVLEMKDKMALTPVQASGIEHLFQNMKADAIPLGMELIELERQLNQHFAAGSMTEALLHQLLVQTAKVHSQLRYVHLSAHLKTSEILTPEQIALYNRLRGYGVNDPCNNIPQGHDPQMWRRHHNCP